MREMGGGGSYVGEVRGKGKGGAGATGRRRGGGAADERQVRMVRVVGFERRKQGRAGWGNTGVVAQQKKLQKRCSRDINCSFSCKICLQVLAHQQKDSGKSQHHSTALDLPLGASQGSSSCSVDTEAV